MTPFVSAIVDHASRQYPKLAYHVSVNDVTTLLRGLRDRELDLVIARWTPSSPEQDFVAEILFKDRLVVMAGARHPLANRRKSCRLSTLRMNDGRCRRMIRSSGRWWCKPSRQKASIVPQTMLTSISVQMRLNLLEGGRFLTIHPISLLRHAGNRGRFKALPVAFRTSQAQ